MKKIKYRTYIYIYIIHPTMEIYDDIFVKISEFLCDRDKIRWTMTCIKMDKLKFIFTYVEKIDIDVIVNLSYYENFENIATRYCDIRRYLYYLSEPTCLTWCILSNNLLHLLNKNKLPNKMKHHHFVTNVIKIPFIDLKSMHKETLPFDKNISDRFPNGCIYLHASFGITHLTINYLNNEIVDFIPNTVTHLTFGDDFDQSLPVLPTSVVHLTFGEKFNNPIKCIMSPYLTHLEFGFDFNQSIDNCLPQTVTHLIFGESFNQPIINNIPNSVTYLEFGSDFNQIIESYVNLDGDICHGIPASVTHLKLGAQFNKSIGSNSVTHLILDGYPITIPPSVFNLILGDNFDFSTIDKNYIPLSVTHLLIENFSTDMFDYIPQSVTYLTVKAYDLDDKVREMCTSLKNEKLPNVKQFIIDYYGR